MSVSGRCYAHAGVPLRNGRIINKTVIALLRRAHDGTYGGTYGGGPLEYDQVITR